MKNDTNSIFLFYPQTEMLVAIAKNIGNRFLVLS